MVMIEENQRFILMGWMVDADDNSAFMIGVGFGSYKDFKALDKGKQKKVIGKVTYGTKK